MNRLSVVIVLLSISCVAQVQPQVMLDKCAQAMGAYQQQHLQIIAEGVQSINQDESIPVRIKTRGLEDFRMERGGGDQTELSIISKGRGSQHGQGKKLAVARHTAAYFKADHLPALMCGANHASKGMRVTYEGDDMVGGRPVFHFKLEALPRGKNQHEDAIESLMSEYHIFIDQQSFLILKSAKFVFSPDSIENRSLWETLYSDYRSVNGVLMPFRIENFVSGHPFSTTVFTSITTGMALADQEFEEVN